MIRGARGTVRRRSGRAEPAPPRRVGGGPARASGGRAHRDLQPRCGRARSGRGAGGNDRRCAAGPGARRPRGARRCSAGSISPHPLLAPFADGRSADFTKVRFWKHRVLDAGQLGRRARAGPLRRRRARLAVGAGRPRSGVRDDLGVESGRQPAGPVVEAGATAVEPARGQRGRPGAIGAAVRGRRRDLCRRPGGRPRRRRPRSRCAGPTVAWCTLPAASSQLCRHRSARTVRGRPRGAEQWTFAVNVAPGESDTGPLPLELFDRAGIPSAAILAQDDGAAHPRAGTPRAPRASNARPPSSPSWKRNRSPGAGSAAGPAAVAGRGVADRAGPGQPGRCGAITRGAMSELGRSGLGGLLLDELAPMVRRARRGASAARAGRCWAVRPRCWRWCSVAWRRGGAGIWAWAGWSCCWPPRRPRFWHWRRDRRGQGRTRPICARSRA